MGGATVLKVGDNFASGASKFFLTPHFLAIGGGGTKYCLDS